MCDCYLCYFNIQEGYTALIRAADNGKTECVRLLLDGGADENANTEVHIMPVTMNVHVNVNAVKALVLILDRFVFRVNFVMTFDLCFSVT